MDRNTFNTISHTAQFNMIYTVHLNMIEDLRSVLSVRSLS
jgi:hypothetical protein